MTIDQSTVIDTLGVDRITGHVVLTIIDSLDWTDEKTHLLLLENKINAYLRFIESGEINDAYPDANGRRVLIRIACLFDLPDCAREFVESARTIIETAGFGLEVSH
jgi:hypothetical protein